MKKLFTSSILLASAAFMMAQVAGPNPLPEKLYMMEEEGISINATLAPGADDQALTLNDGVYEGKVSLTKDVAFRFYVGTASDYQVLGPSRDTYTTQVSFSTYQNYEGTCFWYDTTAEKGNWTPFMEQGITELEVNMTVNPTEGTVVFAPIQPKEPAPEAMYVWGSIDGGETFKSFATLEPTDDNPYVFTVTFDVPKCGPFDGMGSGQAPGIQDKNEGFYFKLSEANTGGGNMYGYPTNDDDPDGKYIELEEDGEPYVATLARTQASNLVALTPGLTTFTFDFETWEFTAELIEEYVEPAYYIWGSIDGGYKYTCAGEMELNEDGVYELSVDVPECGPFDDDPDAGFGPTISFESGYFLFVSTDGESVSAGTSYIAPDNDCIIEFTQTSTNFSVTLDEAGGADLHALVAQTPGKTIFTFDPETLVFTATFDDVLTKVESLTKNEVVGPVYNLQGVKVADSNNLNGLNGIFIINGKKVVIK